MCSRYSSIRPNFFLSRCEPLVRCSSSITPKDVLVCRRRPRASSKRRLRISVNVHHPQCDWGPGGPKWFWEDRSWVSREWMMHRDPANNAMHLFGIIVNITGWFGLGLAMLSFAQSRQKARDQAEDDLFYRHLGFLHSAEDRVDDHGMVLDGYSNYFAYLREDPKKRAELSRRYRHLLRNGDFLPACNADDSPSQPGDIGRARIEDVALYDLWYHMKLQGDAQANNIDRDRRKMKNFFNVAFRTWKQNQAPRHRAELQIYLHEAWSQRRIKQFLEHVVAMDKAVVRAQGHMDWQRSRPEFYKFIGKTWGCQESDGSLVDLEFVQIEVVDLPQEIILDGEVSRMQQMAL